MQDFGGNSRGWAGTLNCLIQSTVLTSTCTPYQRYPEYFYIISNAVVNNVIFIAARHPENKLFVASGDVKVDCVVISRAV